LGVGRANNQVDGHGRIIGQSSAPCNKRQMAASLGL